MEYENDEQFGPRGDDEGNTVWGTLFMKIWGSDMFVTPLDYGMVDPYMKTGSDVCLTPFYYGMGDPFHENRSDICVTPLDYGMGDTLHENIGGPICV